MRNGKRPAEDTELISLSAAARLTGASVSTLRRHAAAGTLRATKTGPRAWVTTKTAALAWKHQAELHKRGPRIPRKVGD